MRSPTSPGYGRVVQPMQLPGTAPQQPLQQPLHQPPQPQQGQPPQPAPQPPQVQAAPPVDNTPEIVSRVVDATLPRIPQLDTVIRTVDVVARKVPWYVWLTVGVFGISWVPKLFTTMYAKFTKK